ncbi:MAG: Mbeg1-like protein [Fusicatenibacter sp.]
MGNIYSYLKWRGDLSFSERPFCEVDNLVLSELSYMDFKGIVPTKEEGGSITLEEAATQFKQQNKQLITFGSESTPIVECMAETNRFRFLKLSNYVDILDEQTQTQFAALHIDLGDGTTYVAFRGTDDSLVGWREDFSIIGALFEHEKPTKIVSSSAEGFMQHQSSTWQIEGDHFCEKESRSEKYKFFNDIFHTWVESASLEQRAAFTKDFFDALESSGAKCISDLSNSGIGEIETILLSITTQSEGKTKIVIGKLAASALHTFGHVDYKELLKTGSTIQGAICLLIGLFFMMAPSFATRSIGIGLGLAALFWLGRRLLSNAFSEEPELQRKKYKILLYMVAMCLVSFLIAKANLMLRFTNLFVGVSFLIVSFKQFRKGTAPKKHTGSRVLYITTGALLFILGIIPIVFLGLEFTPYAGIAGVCFCLYGITRIVYSMYENGKQNT